MKTVEEIVVRITELEQGNTDFLGFQRSDLIDYLPFDLAKPYLRDGVTSDQWKAAPLTEEAVKESMLDYMEFAWGKANNCRGISAGRSVAHYEAWLWVLEDDLGQALEGIYEYYGKPCLRAICEKYGWDWKQWDDGEWRNDERDDSVPPPKRIAV